MYTRHISRILLCECILIRMGTKQQQTDIAETLAFIVEHMATKDDIADIRSDIADIRSDIADIRADIVDIRADIADIRSELREIHKRLDALEEKVDSHSGYAKEIDFLMNEVKTLRMRVDALEAQQAQG